MCVCVCVKVEVQCVCEWTLDVRERRVSIKCINEFFYSDVIHSFPVGESLILTLPESDM